MASRKNAVVRLRNLRDREETQVFRGLQKGILIEMGKSHIHSKYHNKLKVVVQHMNCFVYLFACLLGFLFVCWGICLFVYCLFIYFYLLSQVVTNGWQHEKVKAYKI